MLLNLVTAKGPESTAWLLPLKGEVGRDVSANKWTRKCNGAKPVIGDNTWHRATFWVRNINSDPPLAELIIRICVCGRGCATNPAGEPYSAPQMFQLQLSLFPRRGWWGRKWSGVECTNTKLQHTKQYHTITNEP